MRTTSETPSEAQSSTVSSSHPSLESKPLAPHSHRYAAAFLVAGQVIARATSTTEKRAIRQVQEAAKRIPPSLFAGAVLRTRRLRPEELRPESGKSSRHTRTNRDLLRKIQLFAGPLYLCETSETRNSVPLSRDQLMSILGQDLDGRARGRFSLKGGKGYLTVAAFEQEGLAIPTLQTKAVEE